MIDYLLINFSFLEIFFFGVLLVILCFTRIFWDLVGFSIKVTLELIKMLLVLLFEKFKKVNAGVFWGLSLRNIHQEKEVRDADRWR